MKFALGGTAPGLWGDTGVPGIRGRPGGKHLEHGLYSYKPIFLFISSWHSWISRQSWSTWLPWLTW